MAVPDEEALSRYGKLIASAMLTAATRLNAPGSDEVRVGVPDSWGLKLGSDEPTVLLISNEARLPDTTTLSAAGHFRYLADDVREWLQAHGEILAEPSLVDDILRVQDKRGERDPMTLTRLHRAVPLFTWPGYDNDGNANFCVTVDAEPLGNLGPALSRLAAENGFNATLMDLLPEDLDNSTSPWLMHLYVTDPSVDAEDSAEEQRPRPQPEVSGEITIPDSFVHLGYPRGVLMDQFEREILTAVEQHRRDRGETDEAGTILTVRLVEERPVDPAMKIGDAHPYED